MTYKGPCITCGTVVNQQYIRKMCLSCYNKIRKSPTFEPRRKYTGPCIECGSYTSAGGNFVRKMCSICYSRYKEGRLDNPPTAPYDGPCEGCDKGCKDTGHYAHHLCRSCYKKKLYRKNNPPPPPKFCPDCGIERPRKARIERCRRCHRKYLWHTDKKYRQQTKEINKRFNQTKRGKEVARNHNRKRRAQRASVENSLTPEDWGNVLILYDYRCAYCGASDSIEMDHIVPISLGGPHTISNVVPACRSCNASKCDGPPPGVVQPVML